MIWNNDYLILGTADHQTAFSQPADRGFGVSERHAGQSDASPLLGLDILRWCVCECGGGWGVQREAVDWKAKTIINDRKKQAFFLSFVKFKLQCMRQQQARVPAAQTDEANRLLTETQAWTFCFRPLLKAQQERFLLFFAFSHKPNALQKDKCHFV